MNYILKFIFEYIKNNNKRPISPKLPKKPKSEKSFSMANKRWQYLYYDDKMLRRNNQKIQVLTYDSNVVEEAYWSQNANAWIVTFRDLNKKAMYISMTDEDFFKNFQFGRPLLFAKQKLINTNEDLKSSQVYTNSIYNKIRNQAIAVQEKLNYVPYTRLKIIL